MPQRKPRRAGTRGASIGTGSSAGSASGVICTVPRAGRPVSSGPITTTPGSSSLNVAGRRCGVFSLIAVGLRSGTGGRGRGGCEAARARRRPCAPAAAAGSAGSGNRPVRKRVLERPRKPPLNSSSGSAGRSPGKVATSVSPSKASPLAVSPGAGVPMIDGSFSRPRATCASRVARTADSATTSMAAPAYSARSAALATARRSTASSRSWL